MPNTKLFDLLNQIPQCFEEPFIRTSEELDVLVRKYGLIHLHATNRIMSPIADFEGLWYGDTCIAILSHSASKWFHTLCKLTR